MRTGQELIIPRAPATLLAGNTNSSAAPTVVAAARRTSGPQAEGDDSEPQPRTVTHRVRRGETLFAIARLYDTTVEKIKSLNRLRSNLIAPGDRLKILTR